MRYLIPLLAFLLIGCDGENSNVAPSKDSPEETASGTKPPEAVSVNPNLKYGIKGDAVTITGCDKKASGELIIAAKIEGKPVTKIGEGAFEDCTSLTNITIPDSVTFIAQKTFSGCNNLTSITIPNSINRICHSTFWNCSNLTSVTIPDGVTNIGTDAFRGCTSLTSITIPDSFTTIYDRAFRDCTGLTSITIPDSVKFINGNAFYGCSSLTSVTFLGDAPNIRDNAFQDSSPTIYRKADAKGWGDTFAGRPVKLITEKP